MRMVDRAQRMCGVGRGHMFHRREVLWGTRFFMEYFAYFVITCTVAMEILPYVFTHLPRADSGWKAWDGEYYLRIREKGYGYEKNHAFMPLMPLLLQQGQSHWAFYNFTRVVFNMVNLYLLDL